MTAVMLLALIAIAVIVRNVSLHQFNLPPMKNKRVSLKKKSKKQNTKMPLARRLLDDCSSDDEDDEDDEDTSKLLLSKMNAGSQTNSFKEEYLPSTRPLMVYKVPTDVRKVVLRDHMSGGMKNKRNKRVPPKKQKQTCNLQENCWRMMRALSQSDAQCP